MTARQPRSRRRATPPTSLPRPTATPDGGPTTERSRGARGVQHHRRHHVTTDYGYVRRDLLALTVFAVAVMAFVVAVAII